MSLTKAQVLNIKDKADALLKKMEVEDKDKVLASLEVDKAYKTISKTIKDFNQGQQSAIQTSERNTQRLLEAIQGLSGLVANQSPQENVLKGIDKLVKSLPKAPKDNTDKLVKAIKAIKGDTPSVEFPKELPVHVLSQPPRKVPQPVTNININALRGFAHTTAQTASTTLATLPSYGVLDSRRTLMAFNNSSTVTIFIGGSSLTSSNGFPVPPKTYSPPIDAGENMILYVRTSSSTADLRVFEVSNDNIGS